MDKYNLDFCLKGSRMYVQGPDIFDAVINKIQEKFDISKIKDIKYAAHDMLLANATLMILENFNRDDFEKINSIITFKINDKKYHAVVVQNDIIIECSNEYSEEVVRSKSVIDGSNIVFENILDDSLTELIVSMNKYFLQKIVTEDGKWIVTKFDYINLIDLNNIKNKQLQLELTNNFNNKLTKSRVKVADKLVGYLYFSLI
jgi:hypothetical protein